MLDRRQIRWRISNGRDRIVISFAMMLDCCSNMMMVDEVVGFGWKKGCRKASNLWTYILPCYSMIQATTYQNTETWRGILLCFRRA